MTAKKVIPGITMLTSTLDLNSGTNSMIKQSAKAMKKKFSNVISVVSIKMELLLENWISWNSRR